MARARQKLSKTEPKIIIQTVIALERIKDDRAAAIMAGAFVENALGFAIFSRLREMDKNDQLALLDNQGHGALANFSTKIWIGYALNLYDVGARKDLLSIKNVRNDFSHEMEEMDFSDPDIVKLCTDLEAPKWKEYADRKPQSSDPKTRFMDTVHYLAAGLDIAARHNIKRPAAADTLIY